LCSFSTFEFECARAERMRRHLQVQHERGDVAVVRSDLPPAFGALVRAHPYEADEFVAERLDARDLHVRKR
jgi:hypothetical protein